MGPDLFLEVINLGLDVEQLRDVNVRLPHPILGRELLYLLGHVIQLLLEVLLPIKQLVLVVVVLTLQFQLSAIKQQRFLFSYCILSVFYMLDIFACEFFCWTFNIVSFVGRAIHHLQIPTIFLFN